MHRHTKQENIAIAGTNFTIPHTDIISGPSHGVLEAPAGQGTPCYKETIISHSCMIFVDSKNIYGNPGLQHLNFTIKIWHSPVFLV